MRKIFLFITFFFFAGLTFAQVQAQLQQPPPNQLKATDLWKAIIINTGYSPLKVTLTGTLEVRGEGIVVTGQSKLITLPKGSKMISYTDVKDGDISFKTGKWSEAFFKTGKAPSGDYTICLHVKAEDGRELGSSCIDQNIIVENAENITPQLISPVNGSTQESSMPLLFSWMLPSVKPGDDFTYKIKLVEIINNQSPMEAVKQNLAWFEKSDIKSKMLQYPLAAKKIEANKKYAWAVQLVDKNGQGVGENGGMSDAFSFEATGNKKTKSLTVASSDSTISGGGTGTVAVNDTIKAGHNGEFKVVVTDVTKEADSSLTGKGKVYIKWLMTSVAVEFKKIRVDTTKHLTTGGIVTTQSGSSSTSYQAYPLAWAQSVLSGPGVANVVDNVVTWSNNKIDNIVSWVNGLNFGQPQINYQSNIPPPAIPNNALKMPFGLQFNNGNQKLVITEMIFKKNESKINFLAQENFVKSGNTYKLGFAGKYFVFHPSSISFNNGRVELAEDINIPTPKMKFSFKKGSTNSGCFVVWDSTGVKNIGLGIEVKFTRDWLLPTTAPLTDSVKATLSGSGTNLHDILLTGSLAGCEIVGTNGLKILADSISLDLSDTRNPGSIHFPKNYPHDTTATWQGFYVKTFSLTMPEAWKTGTNQSPPNVSATNIIIDDFGLTTKILATNVIMFPMGKVADLSASIDTVRLSILNNSLTSGVAKGILVLPISKDTISNSLKYTATFNQVSGANNFQIVILPSGPISADVFKAKMTLLPTSNITAVLSSNSKSVSLNLNGNFKWDHPILSVDPSSNTIGNMPIRTSGIKGINMEMDFENVGLNYTSSANTNTLTFNPGTWSFASPPKWVSNFPVTIKKIYYKSLPTSPASGNNKELVKGALMMDIVANLTDDIGGSTTVGAAFAVEFNKSTIKFTPKFKGVFIDSLSVHADIPAVKIDGYLKLFEDDPKFGSGFNAGIDVTFTAVNLEAKALVQFGNTAYQNNSQFYRYWRVEADVILPVGIPFLPGVGFYGFGGGAYYNMDAKLKTGTSNVSNAFTFEPKKGFKGLKVSATIGTLPKVETFNADVSLSAQFNANNGLDMIDFAGNFWLATKIPERSTSKLFGDINISYTFPTKIFDLHGHLTIASPSISTPVGHPVDVHLNIDGHANQWYFKCGVPTNPNTVNVLGLSLYSYLMFGNNLGTDTPHGFTDGFKSRYAAINGHNPDFESSVGSGGAGTATTTGKGLALGVGVNFSKPLNWDLGSGLCRKWSVETDVEAGAELNLAFLEYNNCGGYNPFGINGWRASGSLGLYGKVSVTLSGKNYQYVAGYAVCSDKTYQLIDARIGAWVQGSFPKPEYFAGRIETTIHFFGDLVDVAFSKDFQYGSDCTSGTAVTTPNGVQEDKAADYKNKLIQYIAPNTTYNFPVASPINVKYSLVPDQVFDVAENQSDGTIKNRTFKMVVTKSLEAKNVNGSWSAKTLQSRANNIGEWQYFIKPPMPTTATQSTNSGIIAANLNAGNTSSNNAALSNHQLLNSTTINMNSGHAIFASGGSFAVTNIPNPLPPPPPPNYPNPIPDPVNNLLVNTDYKFVVTATLMESSSVQVLNTGTSAGRGTGYHSEQAWVQAKTNSGIPITETKTVSFSTGGIPLANANSVGNQVH